MFTFAIASMYYGMPCAHMVVIPACIHHTAEHTAEHIAEHTAEHTAEHIAEQAQKCIWRPQLLGSVTA